MKIIFTVIHIENTPPAFPLAAAVLKTAVEQNPQLAGWSTGIRDFYLPAEPDVIASKLTGTGAEVIAFSCYTWNAEAVLQTAALIRKNNPGTIMIAGGSQVTAAPDDFAGSSLFNFIVTGEGEKAVQQILSNLPAEKAEIEKLAVESVNILIHSDTADFSSSVSPYPSLLSAKSRYKGVLWEITRGCPYNCSFCYEAGGEKGIRQISPTRIKEELEFFRSLKVKKIWVLDPTFNFKSSEAAEILRLIIETYPDAEYTFEIRVELMTLELCELFSELDCSLQIGLQSTDAEVLKLANRKLDVEKFISNCLMMSDYGLRFGIDLIYGLPGDSIDRFIESVDFAVSAMPNNIDIFPLSILPGTKLSTQTQDFGIQHTGFPDYRITGSETFSAEDLSKADELTAVLDRIYNIERSFIWLGAVCRELDLKPSALLMRMAGTENFRSITTAEFLRNTFLSTGKKQIWQIIRSFIIWSEAAEKAFSCPGEQIKITLSYPPEILDELIASPASDIIKANGQSCEKSYTLFFDGEELYIN